MPALEEGLHSGLISLQLSLDGLQVEKCLDYLALLQKWNKLHNLTAIRDPNDMLTHHLLDSLAVVQPLRRRAGTQALRLLDVGSGAGLPGVLLAIACPQMEVTCVDAVAKKAAFVQQAASELGLRNLAGVHSRVEKLAAPAFDVVSSRAFASLTDMVNLTKFHVKPASSERPKGGVWLAMKGKRPDGELAQLPSAARLIEVETLHVPGLDAERCIVWLQSAHAAA
jgi:16S rRNA (guanine527-N7)-methyltransferase